MVYQAEMYDPEVPSDAGILGYRKDQTCAVIVQGIYLFIELLGKIMFYENV